LHPVVLQSSKSDLVISTREIRRYTRIVIGRILVGLTGEPKAVDIEPVECFGGGKGGRQTGCPLFGPEVVDEVEMLLVARTP
jgi:hypothetical protein